jgi:hypothetical protein
MPFHDDTTASEALHSLSRTLSSDPSRFAEASRDSDRARAELASVGLGAPEGVSVSSVGLGVPDGVSVRLLRNDSTTLHFAIPSNPNSEMHDADLDVSGGLVRGRLSSLGSASTLLSTAFTLSTMTKV